MKFAEPAGEHRLVRAVGRSNRRLGNGLRVDMGIRRQDRQYAVDTGIIQAGIDCIDEPRRVGIEADVDRVAVGPRAGVQPFSLSPVMAEKLASAMSSSPA